LSALFLALAYVPFIHGTINGSVIPNRASWIVWFMQDCLITASAVMTGVGEAIVMPVIWLIGTGIVMCLSLKQGTRDSFNTLEKFCMGLSFVGILLSIAMNNPRFALIAGITASCIGGLPTTFKAWAKPWTEPLTGWLLFFAGTILNALAVTTWTFDSGFLIIVAAFFQIILLLPLLYYKLFTTGKKRC